MINIWRTEERERKEKLEGKKGAYLAVQENLEAVGRCWLEAGLHPLQQERIFEFTVQIDLRANLISGPL